VPASVDYNLWAGPSPMQVPLRRKNFHYDWHWIWDYGNGEIGNNSVHSVDLLRKITGLQGLGRGVLSYGARHFDDAGETFNTQVVIHDFDSVTVVQEVRNLKTGPAPFGDGVVVVRGTEGILVAGYGGVAVVDPDGKPLQKLQGRGDDHFANFIQAVRSRKVEDLNAPILEGHTSTALCHLGNISCRLGQPTADDEIKGKLESLKKDGDLVGGFETIRKHLADNHGNEAAQHIKWSPLRLGPWLAIDPDKETFLDNPAANALLTQEYRKPFVVPGPNEI
jgi:hypothetical protein